MDYCTDLEVKTGHKDLEAEHVLPLLPSFIAEASGIVRDDLGGTLDLSTIEAENIPAQINRLAIYKTRELAYRCYLGSTQVIDVTSVDINRRDYEALLKQIRDGFVETGLTVKQKPSVLPALKFM